MKRSKFSKSQMAFILGQAEEGTSVEEVCRKAGISQATILQLAQEVRWVDAVGDETPQAARGGERSPEANRGGPFARQGDAAGRH